MNHSRFSPASPHAGQNPSAAERPSDLLGELAQVRVGGRQWYVHPAAEHLVRECHLCNSAMASRVTCGFVGHRVCTPCFDGWIKAQQEDPKRAPDAALTCSDCRQPLRSAVEREIDERSLALLREPVRLLCGECMSWAGPLTALDEHARRCQQLLHPCQNQAQGCEWVGVRDDLPEHHQICDWRQVTCGHQGCPVQMLFREKAAHETECRLRPVQVGQLKTTAEKWQQLQGLYQFCQQGPAGVRNAVPAWMAQQRLEEIVTLVPLLYQALSMPVLQQTGPASPDQCGWCCAFTGTAGQVTEHVEHCPAVVRICHLCEQRMPRRLLSAHAAVCPRRVMPCPRGCGELGLHADDLAAGLHERTCVAMPKPCRWCRTEMDGRLKAAHEERCEARLLLCTWCLDYHQKRTFAEQEAGCRSRLADSVTLGDMPLALASRAVGPVYFPPGNDQDLLFIRLPVRLLTGEMQAEFTSYNLTGSLQFMWAGVPCKLRTTYLRSSHTFSMAVTYDYGCTLQGKKARAALYSQDGSLVEELGYPDSRAPGRQCLYFACRDTQGGEIVATNGLLGLAPDTSLFLQLGPFVP